MIKILWILIDKVSLVYVQQLIEVYEKRLKHYCNLEVITITIPKNVRYKSIEEQKAEEEKQTERFIQPSDFVILLDEKGKEMTSLEFAQWLEKQMGSGKRLVFITGGPYGLSDNIKQKYKTHISLSVMTFSHELVRVIFLEQLYRAFTIIKGKKYHHP